MSLRQILGYRWHDFLTNDLVLTEAGLRQITCLVGEHLLCGHVARLRGEDPTHRILSLWDSGGWTMPMGRPQGSWLRQVKSYLKDTGMTA